MTLILKKHLNLILFTGMLALLPLNCTTIS